MVETVGVSQLVDRFGGCALHKQGSGALVRAVRVQTSERDDGDAAMCIGLAEHEVQLGHIQIDIGHTEQPLRVARFHACELPQDWRGVILAALPVIGRGGGQNPRHRDNFRVEGRTEDEPQLEQDIFHQGIADWRDGDDRPIQQSVLLGPWGTRATSASTKAWHTCCSIQQTFHSFRERIMGCSTEESIHYAPVEPTVEPAYMTLFCSGELAERAKGAVAHLGSCDLCARYCRVDRFLGVKGAVCRTGVRAMVHSFGPHYGEERSLSGTRGSGTIFFTWCNLRCVFCQNYQIAQLGEGHEVSAEQLADMMLQLQRRGCHNINLVTPSHVVAQILQALVLAAASGLRLPLVYNTSGYESQEALALLDGVVDIYLPDMKYGDSAIARRHSKIPDYVEVNQAAVREMYRQVGELTLDEHGIALRGLLVRHLVLPGGLAGTEQVLGFLSRELSPTVSVNVMGQYQPYFKAAQYPPLDRPLTVEEFQAAVASARRSGLPLVDGPDGDATERAFESHRI